MPILKHAKKKLKQDKIRTRRNMLVEEAYKRLVKAARKSKSPKDVSKAFQSVDKAAKNKILHKNKAARIKSSLSKVIKTDSAPKETKKAVAAKKTVKKPAVKKASK